MASGTEMETIAATLEATGDYRILRRLKPWKNSGIQGGQLGCIIDLETTGLDPSRDECIEFAALRFSYNAHGICELLDQFHSYNEPSISIPSHITTLTGINDETVRGHRIDRDELAAFLAPCEIVVAHNCKFDAPFAVKLSGLIREKNLACSMTQVPWQEEGFEGTKLAYLAASTGFFYDRHRALDDCAATLELLSRKLRNGSTAWSHLVEASERVLARVFAPNSPFELKDILKRRGYRWSPGDSGSMKAWYIDIEENFLEAEIEFLQKEIYLANVQPHIVRLSSAARFLGGC